MMSRGLQRAVLASELLILVGLAVVFVVAFAVPVGSRPVWILPVGGVAALVAAFWVLGEMCRARGR